MSFGALKVCCYLILYIYIYIYKVTGKEMGQPVQVFCAYILYLLVSVKVGLVLAFSL